MVYATSEAEELAKVTAERDELRAQVTALLAQVAELTARVKSLELQLNQNSTNSHKSPSSDGPGKRKRKKRGSGRKPGGQKGHQGSHRELLPEEQVDNIVDEVPDVCERCGGQLEDTGDSPERIQVTEIPPVNPTVTEYRLHKRKCTCCKAITKAQAPAHVHGSFGPRLVAVMAMLRGGYRQSVRCTQSLVKHLFNVDISTGAISYADRQMQLALEAPYQEALEAIRNSDKVNIDETSYPVESQRHWLWTAVSGMVCAFTLHKSRGRKPMKILLGDNYDGIVISDRWSTYSCYDLEKRQLCWAHLKRDFQKMVDLKDEDSHIGAALLVQEKKLFKAWGHLQEGHIQSAEFEALVNDTVAPAFKRLLDQGKACASEKIKSMCTSLAKTSDAMWTFVSHPGIDPTNNAAERALRHSVIWRLLSHGTQSQRGARFVERILTVVASLSLQGRNLLDYLERSITAYRCGLDYPSLLPQPDTG